MGPRRPWGRHVTDARARNLFKTCTLRVVTRTGACAQRQKGSNTAATLRLTRARGYTANTIAVHWQCGCGPVECSAFFHTPRETARWLSPCVCRRRPRHQAARRPVGRPPLGRSIRRARPAARCRVRCTLLLFLRPASCLVSRRNTCWHGATVFLVPAPRLLILLVPAHRLRRDIAYCVSTQTTLKHMAPVRCKPLALSP